MPSLMNTTCHRLGKSAKENMIATLNEKEVFAGGVFAAANHVADFVKMLK